MPIPTVWSERNDVVAGLHDCAYSSILMCLVYGGKTSYPDGIYTAAEREALERSDAAPDEMGANSADIDVAIRNRYGLSAHTPTTLLDELLKVRGTAVSVGGKLSNLPTGSTLRRYAPDYTGGHRVCVLPRGDGSVRWLDPLAPFDYAGDVVGISTVMLFNQGRSSTDARYVNQDQYLNATTGGTSQGGTIDLAGFQFQLANPPVAGLVTFDAGVKAYSCLDAHAYATLQGATRDGVSAISGGGSRGYIVDLSEGGNVPTQAYFIYASAATFAPSSLTAPAATPLAPGLYEVK